MRKKSIYALALVLLLTLSSFVYSEPLYGPASFSATEKNWFSRNYHHLSFRHIQLETAVKEGKIIIRKPSDKKIKRGLVVFNHRFIPLKRLIRGNEPLLEVKVRLKKLNSLFVYFTGEKNASITIELNSGAATPAPEVISFSAVPDTIDLGQSLDLQWEVENADTVSIDNSIGAVDTAGSLSVSPTESTTYTLTAEGPGGTASADVPVTVNIPPPTVTINVSPSSITAGESAVLSWQSEDASSCTINPDIGPVDLSGTSTVNPKTTTTYTITALGQNGDTITDSATLSVSGPPVINVGASLIRIKKGEPAQLNWTSEGADLVHIDQGVGFVSEAGTVSVSPETSITYIITASNAFGASSETVKVKVLSAPETLPEGSFGINYQDLIPEDATLEAYDTRRFSLMTGLVTGIDGTPVNDVDIMVFNHPEYGTASTDEEGRFAIPVEGGEDLTLSYEKQGMITVHRKAYVPWNDFAALETVQMISEDTVSTQIVFDGDASSVFIHRSTPITDELGTRSVTLITTGDNQAFVTDKDGNDVVELKTINVRASEYQTPESMPAVLPPTSAFTYCAELSVDGAQRVRFENPVTALVDNFLGFDVGTLIPVGSYNRDCGCWIPENNAWVVRLLDTDADGIVDAMDVDGDDQPDDLNRDGSVNDEATGLDDPDEYQPGKTMWRFLAKHFSPWDTNSPANFPQGAIDPNSNRLPYVDKQKLEEDDCKNDINSYVEERSRIFHESIPIPGTGVNLHYSTVSLSVNKTEINIPVSGDTVPETLEGISLVIDIAGKEYSYSFDPLPNINHQFLWDGLDVFGNTVTTPVQAKIKIHFLYRGYLGTSSKDFYAEFVKLFAKYPEIYTPVDARLNLKKTQSHIVILDPPKISTGTYLRTLAEGWTLSNHHFVSAVDPAVLHKGDGGTVSSFNPEYKYMRTDDFNLIDPVGGTGRSGFSGDNGPATQAEFDGPNSIAVDAAGNVYIADTYNRRVRKIDTQGVVTTIAGNGDYGDPFNWPNDPDGEDNPVKIVATDAAMLGPVAVAVDNKGNIFITDVDAEFKVGCIRKVDVNGMMTNAVGGYGGSLGDNEPANSSTVYLAMPSGIAVDNNSNLFIADTRHHRIRMVDPGGIITTIAGNGEPGYSGDGGRSMQGQLNYPADVKTDKQGNVYIADQINHVIRKIDIDGIITTVAGTGESGYSGDGGPADQAHMSYPEKIDLDAEGNIYVVDRGNGCLRKINTNGIIKTISGNGGQSHIPEGTFPVEPELLTDFSGLAIIDPGNIFVSFSQNNLIAKIGPLVPYTYLESEENHVYSEKSRYGHVINSKGQHIKTIDLESGTMVYEFDYTENSPNVLTAVTDTFSNIVSIERDQAQIPTAIISPEGLRTELSIDENNHLTRITYPDGSHYDFQYSPEGFMEIETDPGGNQFLHTFTESGKIRDVKDENGGHWIYEREYLDDDSVLTRITTGEGNLRTYLDTTDTAGVYTSVITDQSGGETFYTSSGLTAEKTNACGLQMKFEYGFDPKFNYQYLTRSVESTPSGLTRTTRIERNYTEPEEGENYVAHETREVNGNTTKLDHDVTETRKTITSPENRITTILYNPDTLQPETVQIPGLLDTSYQYDSKGRLLTSETGNRRTEFSYNEDGFIERITDPKGNERTFTHDENGRITQTHRPDITDVFFSYDANGNVTVLTTPVPADHSFGYNKVNLNTDYSPPLSSSYTFEFDKDRRPTRTVFPSGKVLENIYESGLNRLESIQTPEGPIEFSYLCGSKIGSVSKGEESIAYEYDAGLVTSQTLTGTSNQVLSHSYNNDFRLSGFTYAGQTTGFTYDNDGLLTEAGSFTIARNADNGLPESVSDSTLDLNRDFNGFGEISSQEMKFNSNGLFSWQLERDDNGRITRKTETLAGTSIVFDYTYDTMGRLLTVTKDGELAESYQYNSNGARISEINTLRGISQRDYQYSQEDHLLKAGSVEYIHDADGFLARKIDDTQETAYTYSIRGELLNVTLPDGSLIEYIHDPLGRRIAKKINGQITEKYLWQGLSRLLAIYGGSNSLLMTFEYAGNRMPVSMAKGGVVYYLAYDQVGSIRAVVDVSNNVVKKIDYDSFGNVINDTEPDFEVPFGFAGGLYGPDTGLIRFGFRDYDPDTGRWTAKDPIFFAGGDTDLYGYVLNDPINWIDPLGLWNYATGITGDGLTENMTSIEGSVDRSYFDAGGDNAEATVTSTTGGTHSTDSLHYSGNAVDLRVWGLTDAERADWAQRIRDAIGNDYDVLNEGDHIHVEYDPCE